MRKLAVIAFGGNALLRANQSGTIKEQEQNAYDTLKNLTEFVWRDYDMVLTHGNGPQVGNILLRFEAGYSLYKLPKMPLDLSVAASQGSIGYILEQQLHNIFVANNISRRVFTIISRVVIDKNDIAFQNPTKPVGQYFLKEEADLLAKANGWSFKEDARKRGWRRVVPSPAPKAILNHEAILDLARAGNIVITVGGGGVPVLEEENMTLKGIEAVIDKDLASALLAQQIGADELYLLTDVPKVYINFQKPDEQALDTITVEQAEKYLAEGQFGSGSMGPKVQACINFIRNGGKKAVITDANELTNPDCGTNIISE